MKAETERVKSAPRDRGSVGRVGPRLTPVYVDGVPEIEPEDLLPHLGHVLLVDVRRPEEFNGELGHIAGSLLKTLGKELEAFLESCDRRAELVFVCRSGTRSREATRHSLRLGFTASRNLRGGMIAWTMLGHAVERL